MFSILSESNFQLYPFQNNKFYTFPNWKEFTNNFKFNENGKELSKGVETNVGKGEIARNKQFLFLSSVFKNNCTAHS